MWQSVDGNKDICSAAAARIECKYKYSLLLKIVAERQDVAQKLAGGNLHIRRPGDEG
jgi:hypothetical protein